jgi:hypothetical protein
MNINSLKPGNKVWILCQINDKPCPSQREIISITTCDEICGWVRLTGDSSRRNDECFETREELLQANIKSLERDMEEYKNLKNKLHELKLLFHCKYNIGDKVWFMQKGRIPAEGQIDDVQDWGGECNKYDLSYHISGEEAVTTYMEEDLYSSREELLEKFIDGYKEECLCFQQEIARLELLKEQK